MELLLAHVIERTGIEQPRADRRLNACEAVIGALTRQWREDRPFSPVRDIRMAEPTLGSLLAWVQAEEPGVPLTLLRIAVYESGALTDNDVPSGWVRVLLPVHRP